MLQGIHMFWLYTCLLIRSSNWYSNRILTSECNNHERSIWFMINLKVVRLVYWTQNHHWLLLWSLWVKRYATTHECDLVLSQGESGEKRTVVCGKKHNLILHSELIEETKFVVKESYEGLYHLSFGFTVLLLISELYLTLALLVDLYNYVRSPFCKWVFCKLCRRIKRP